MVPASLEPSLILATDFPATKLPKSLADETLWNVDDGEGWHWRTNSYPTTPGKGMLGTPSWTSVEQSLPPVVSKFLILTMILQKFRLLRRKGSCHSCVFQQVLHQVLLGGRLTLQFTCFRNGLRRESFLALTRGNQAESIPLP